MNLQLSLKTKWFEMTKAGIKTEDYREINPYWASRLFNKRDKNMTKWYWQGFLGRTGIEGARHFRYYAFRNQEQIDYVIKNIGLKSFSQNIMTLGYPHSTDTDRILKLEHKGIEIRTGNPEWGAEPGKLYFVIMHGAIL
jgi:hypothetical protein